MTWFRTPLVMAALMLTAVCAANATAPSAALAQDRTKVVKLLHEARDFRMRVRAVFILADAADLKYSPELEAALADPHPAVRVAAAAALGRIQSSRALPALRVAREDRSPDVRSQAGKSIDLIESATRRNATAALMPVTDTSRPAPSWSQVRRVVIMGEMRSSASYQDRRMTDMFREETRQRLSGLGDVYVVTEGAAMPEQVKRQIRQRHLPVIRLDGRLQSFRRRVDDGTVSVRCEVSFMLVDAKQNAIRGEIRGAASSAEGRAQDRQAQNLNLAGQALRGAVHSALSNAQNALVVAANN